MAQARDIRHSLEPSLCGLSQQTSAASQPAHRCTSENNECLLRDAKCQLSQAKHLEFLRDAEEEHLIILCRQFAENLPDQHVEHETHSPRRPGPALNTRKVRAESL